jgi:hypothetical protein
MRAQSVACFWSGRWGRSWCSGSARPYVLAGLKSGEKSDHVTILDDFLDIVERVCRGGSVVCADTLLD